MADTLNSQTVASLASKLDDFAEVLTKEEHAVLLGLLGMAGDTLEQAQVGADTEGLEGDRATLQLPKSGNLPSLSAGLKDAFRSIPSMGNPGGPVSDSIGVGATCVSWSKDYKIVTPGLEKMKIRGLKQTR